MEISSGYKIHEVSEEDKEERAKYYKGFNAKNIIRVTPGNWLLHSGFKDIADTLFNFKVKSNFIDKFQN